MISGILAMIPADDRNDCTDHHEDQDQRNGDR